MLPVWLDFNGFDEQLVRFAAERYIRTDGKDYWTPDEIRRIPLGWDQAVKRMVNIMLISKPTETTPSPTRDEASGA